MSITTAVQEFAQRLAELGQDADGIEIVLPERAWTRLASEVLTMERLRPTPSFMGVAQPPDPTGHETCVMMYTANGPVTIKRAHA